MANPDAAPSIHQPLDTQLSVAQLELTVIASDLLLAAGYKKDPIAEALAAFPAASRRRSDTPFSCEPDEEITLRKRVAALGPGRPETESLEDLGIFTADAEVIEPGQLHKTVTEIWRALVTGQQAPLIVFGSDRYVPKWKKDEDKNEDPSLGLDAERQSSDRLLQIGGRGLANGFDFSYRAGIFDRETEIRKPDTSFQDAMTERALGRPDTEYDMTELFLGEALDEIREEVLYLGYDPNNGDIVTDKTGQVRRLGKINGRDTIFVHKEAGADGEALDTTDTILLMGRLAAALTRSTETIIGYWTSSTYKPSRRMSGIRAAIRAAQAGQKLRIEVPTYGYVDLGKIKGESDPKPPTIQNIAGELHTAASEAQELRNFLSSLE